MKFNQINKMDQKEMIKRYMSSRTGDFDWSMPSSIEPAHSNAKLGKVQKSILNESGVLR